MSDYQEDAFSPRELLSIVDDDHDYENPWWNVVWYLQERPHGVVDWIRRATSVNPSLAETVYLRGAVGRAEAELSSYMAKDRRLRDAFVEHQPAFNQATLLWTCLGCIESGVVPTFPDWETFAAHVMEGVR